MRLPLCTALFIAGSISGVSELARPIFSDAPAPLNVPKLDPPHESSPDVIPFDTVSVPPDIVEAGLADVAMLNPNPPSESSPDIIPFDAVLVAPPMVQIELADVLTAQLLDSEVDANANTILMVAAPEQLQNFTRSELCHTAASVAAANNLPIPFFANLIQQESGFKPHVVSSAGAQGIAQFMPKVAASKGLANPFDPIESLTASGKFLAHLVDRFGKLGLAAAAYNAGSQRVRDWIAKRRKLPTETRHYVRRITGLPAEAWARKIVKGTEVRLPPHARCPDAWTLQAQANELTKPALRTISSPKRQTRVSTFALVRPGAITTNKVGSVLVRRSTPQPNQLAMGLATSRIATMATRESALETKDRVQASAHSGQY